MVESNIYIVLWQKYKTGIISKMKSALIEPQEYQLTKHEFEALGKRQNSGYSFNLELNKAELVSNIDGSAVARDLLKVLNDSNAAQDLMRSHYYKIHLSNSFLLKIKVIL